MFRLEARAEPSRAMSLASPLIALLLTAVLAAGVWASLGNATPPAHGDWL